MRSNSTTKKPATTTDRAAKATATEARIRNLVSTLLINDDDEQSQALIALVQMIAEEREFVDRDFMAFVVRKAAFSYTIAFSNACENFTREAKKARIEYRG